MHTLSHTAARAVAAESAIINMFGYFVCRAARSVAYIGKNVAAVLVSKLFIRKFIKWIIGDGPQPSMCEWVVRECFYQRQKIIISGTCAVESLAAPRMSTAPVCVNLHFAMQSAAA